MHSYQHEHGKYGAEVPPVTGNMPTAAGVPNIPMQSEYYPSYSTNLRIQGHSVQWSTGLCHCCDDPANCMITCCCPCITFGQVSEIANHGTKSCASRGTVYALLVPTGFACLYSCFYRSKMRGQFHLEEAPCADCLVHCCCEVCALCQEYRELKMRGFDMGIGWQANMDRTAPGITVSPPMEAGMRR